MRKLWTRFIWLSIGACCMPLSSQYWTSKLHKRQGISWVVERNYWGAISDCTVGSLLKNRRWIYVTLLQMIIFLINVSRFTNQCSGCGCKCFFFCVFVHFFRCVQTRSLLPCQSHSWACTSVVSIWQSRLSLPTTFLWFTQDSDATGAFQLFYNNLR